MSFGTSSQSLDLPSPFASFAQRAEAIDDNCATASSGDSQRVVVNIMPSAALMPSVKECEGDLESEVGLVRTEKVWETQDDASARELERDMPDSLNEEGTGKGDEKNATENTSREPNGVQHDLNVTDDKQTSGIDLLPAEAPTIVKDLKLTLTATIERKHENHEDEEDPQDDQAQE